MDLTQRNILVPYCQGDDLRGVGIGVRGTRGWILQRINEVIPSEAITYDRTNIVLENLLIKTDNQGIVLEGNGNVIRNCIIESGGFTAIMMAGPNGKILNNTIVLQNPFIPASMAAVRGIEPRHVTEFFESKSAPHAAIALRHANGTVISGNHIEVIGKTATRHAIYLDYASKNVRIERNTFFGTNVPVTLANGSTAIMNGNIFEPAKL